MYVGIEEGRHSLRIVLTVSIILLNNSNGGGFINITLKGDLLRLISNIELQTINTRIANETLSITQLGQSLMG